MAKVLLADTNFSAGPIREYLLTQGHEVHLAGGREGDFLAKSTPNYHVCNYANPEELRALAHRLSVDFVIPGCNDQSYWSCAQLSVTTDTGTNIDTPEATLALADKAQFRQLASKLGLHTPKLLTAPPSRADYPIVVKPANAYSGHGISILQATQESQLDQALIKAKQACREGKALIETYVDGQLYSHSAFLKDQQIAWDVIVAEYGGANPFVVDTSYVVHTPNAEMLATVRKDIETLAKHLQLKDGLIHSQFIHGKNGLALIELTRRCPGDLYSHLVKLSTGFNYVGAYADALLGLDFSGAHSANSHTKAIMRHTVTSTDPMLLTQIRFKQPLHLTLQINLATTGDAIEPSPKSRISLLFAHFDTQDLLEDAVEMAVNRQLYELSHAYYLTED